MPHVIVKLWPGKSEKQKIQLANEITQSVMKTLHYGEESVSVAFEEIGSADWASGFTGQTSSAMRRTFTKSRATPCELATRNINSPSTKGGSKEEFKHGNQESRLTGLRRRTFRMVHRNRSHRPSFHSSRSCVRRKAPQ